MDTVERRPAGAAYDRVLLGTSAPRTASRPDLRADLIVPGQRPVHGVADAGSSVVVCFAETEGVSGPEGDHPDDSA
jgi:hypothetical protein